MNRVRTLSITGRDALDTAVSMLSQVTVLENELDDRRLFFVKPLKDHVKNIDAVFKQLAAPLERANEELRRKILIYRDAENKRLAEEQEKRDEAARIAAEKAEALRRKADSAKGKKAKALAAEAEVEQSNAIAIASQSIDAAPERVMRVGDAKIATRKTWKFEITSPDDVPRQYLTVDEPAIRRAIASGIREIPGIRIHEVESLAVGGI